MRRNILEKGPRSRNPACAITIGEESTRHPTSEIMLEDNRFSNDIPSPTVFLRNLTGHTPRLSGNDFQGPVTAVGTKIEQAAKSQES
jgi:hypothetical protein